MPWHSIEGKSTIENPSKATFFLA